MDDDSSVIVAVMDGDKRAWIPLADHERMRRKKLLMTECLMAIAQAMNRMADELEKEGSSIDEETQPAPLE
jgi:hypothetical protein